MWLGEVTGSFSASLGVGGVGTGGCGKGIPHQGSQGKGVGAARPRPTLTSSRARVRGRGLWCSLPLAVPPHASPALRGTRQSAEPGSGQAPQAGTPRAWGGVIRAWLALAGGQLGGRTGGGLGWEFPSPRDQGLVSKTSAWTPAGYVP